MTLKSKRRSGFFLGLMTIAALLLSLPTAIAVQPDEVLSDSALEARARSLSYELRCLVCQNQSIDDSDAPLAKDLRILVRERLVAGDSDAQVKDFLVARFGEFVLLKPPVKPSTLLLWLTPILLLTAAIALAWRQMFSSKEVSAPNRLTASEERALAEMIDDEDASSAPGSKN